MLKLPDLSPAVRRVLDENHFQLIETLAYGPRFVCAIVRSGALNGMFKMVLPQEERHRPNYVWTVDDSAENLEGRIMKEALFLQYFSQQLGAHSFEPQIIAISEASPAWSLRTYIDKPSMSAWDSTFVFRREFYDEVTPGQVFNFFHRIHELSSSLPESLSDLLPDYVPFTLRGRFKEAYKAADKLGFADQAEHINACLDRSKRAYDNYERVISHYEPYSCHLFVDGHKLAFIDWENVGWGHKLMDLSIFWMRMFDNPEWQNGLYRELEQAGYLRGKGLQYWHNELLMQSFANLNHLKYGGTFGTPGFTERAKAFFTQTIEDILSTSPYFQE